MRLLADRPERHRASLEALDDRGRRFDFLDWHRLPVRFELEQASERRQTLTLFVDEPGVLLEQPVIPRTHRMLQLGDRIRVVHVEFAAPPPLILPADIEFAVEIRIGVVCDLVTVGGFARDDIEPDAADARRGPGEVLVDDLLAESNRLEDLSAAITLHGRDAHLGGDLDQALAERLDEMLDRFLLGDALELVVMDHPG